MSISQPSAFFISRSCKDPEKKNLSLESKQMATKAEQNIQTGVGSLATRFSETSSDDDDTAGEGPGRGPQTASQDPRPKTVAPSPPGPAVGRGRPGLGRGRWHGLASRCAPAARRVPRGLSCRAHPHAHTPAAPPAPPRGRPHLSP